MMYSLLVLATLGWGEAPARVTVLLPSEARLYVDDVLCDLTSDTRSFDTPPLPFGRDYYYVLRAVIERGGRTVEVSKRVGLRAGKRSIVDFGDLSGEEAASPSDPGGPTASADYHRIPKGSPPRVTVARMNGEKLEIVKVVQEMRTESYPVSVKDPDGKERTMMQTRNVSVIKGVKEQVDPKTVQAFDADGRSIAAERLPGLLSDDTVCLVAEDGQQVHRLYRNIFRSSTPVLVLSPQPPAMPAPPRPGEIPQLNPVSVKASPRLCLVRLDDTGNLVIRICEERPRIETAYKEVQTEGRTQKVPYSVQSGSFLNMITWQAPASQFKVLDTDGREVAANDIPRLLNREQVVLAATDGEKVDPDYLRQVKKGTLVLIPPKERAAFFLNPYGYYTYGGPLSVPSPVKSMPGPTPIKPLPPAQGAPKPALPNPQKRAVDQERLDSRPR